MIKCVSISRTVTTGCSKCAVTAPTRARCRVTLGVVSTNLGIVVRGPVALLPRESLRLTRLTRGANSEIVMKRMLLFRPTVGGVGCLISDNGVNGLCCVCSGHLGLNAVHARRDIFSSFTPRSISMLSCVTKRRSVNVGTRNTGCLRGGICSAAVALLSCPSGIGNRVFMS